MSRGSVLFIGGTGRISASCVARAVEQGWDVAVLNRGKTSFRPMPDGVESIIGDIRQPESVKAALGDRRFDVVCEFLGMIPDHARIDVELFAGRCNQYIFISTASAYQKPVKRLPITESTPLVNPYWQYSREKIACELVLMHQLRDHGFPVTIVRPSHTMDGLGKGPLIGGSASLQRIVEGRPIVVQGDGTSLWTITHARDFAKAFVGLFGRDQAIGEAFHITSDEVLTWNQIAAGLIRASRDLGLSTGKDSKIIHVTSDVIAEVDAEAGAGMLGDKANSVIFDNAKVKSLVPDYVATTPFEVTARETMQWHVDHRELWERPAENEKLLAELIRRSTI